jgi:hypothetical protein
MILILLIPALIFIIPAHWLRYYATIIIALALFQTFRLLAEQSGEAWYGIFFLGVFLAFNLILLAIRYWLIRRSRKLPAPLPKNE